MPRLLQQCIRSSKFYADLPYLAKGQRIFGSTFNFGVDPGSSSAAEEARAFLHRIPGGQKERNSEDVTAKFQLSPMLAPRWDLPLSRRGVVTFSADQFNAIFDASRDDVYQQLLSEWRSKVNAPFRRSAKQAVTQIGLFDD